MNVKIAESSVTFKISEEELKSLLAGVSLETKIMIGQNDFSMVVNPSSDEAPEGVKENPLHLILDSAKSRLTLYTTQNEIIRLSDMGKSRDGLFAHISGLDVFLQVDVRKDSREKKQKE